MTLPQTAKAQPTQNFLDNLEDIHTFLRQQDANTANTRMNVLRKELRGMVERLSWSPACGRPARYLHWNTEEEQLRLNRIQQLAHQSGLPSLREFVVKQFLILYAHSDTQVALLSIKHQRQLIYRVTQTQSVTH
jgi:hypothetical protein